MPLPAAIRRTRQGNGRAVVPAGHIPWAQDALGLFGRAQIEALAKIRRLRRRLGKHLLVAEPHVPSATIDCHCIEHQRPAADHGRIVIPGTTVDKDRPARDLGLFAHLADCGRRFNRVQPFVVQLAIGASPGVPLVVNDQVEVFFVGRLPCNRRGGMLRAHWNPAPDMLGMPRLFLTRDALGLFTSSSRHPDRRLLCYDGKGLSIRGFARA